MTTATRARPGARSAARPPVRRGAAWWGDGPPPGERWPGVTIEIPAVWRSARDRWESPDGAYFYDQDAADLACEFFSAYLTHHIGEFAGRPFELLPYQALLLTRPIFGWKRSADGYRRFRKVFAFLPKGAGKSPFASGTGLYLMLCDREPAAEIYALAVDKNQARVVHTAAKHMVEDSPELADQCEILRDSIYCPATRSVYQVLSADAATKHGFRPHGAFFDEFHGQPNRDLYEALWRSMAKRRQPVLMITTHAGMEDETICFEEYEYAKRVLSGTVPDPATLPVIFEATDTDEWTNPETWRRVNPGHGITVHHSAIESECQEALAEPRKRNDFLRFHLNRWTNQATAWLPLEWWDRCATPLAPDELLRGELVAAGLDLAQKYDLACFSVVFRHVVAEAPVAVEIAEDALLPETPPSARRVDLNYRISIVPFFWIPADTMREHEQYDGVPYSQWAADGLVTATEGGVIDYSRIYEDITRKIVPRFPLLKQAMIGYDPAFATDLATNLRDRAGLKVAEVLQNYVYLSEPSQVFEALVKAGRVSHGGHRVLRNHVENVAIKTDDARRIRPVRPKKDGKRIDGVVASIMAIKMLAASTPPSFSVFVLGGKR